ncbi:uncharacterized protein [Cebidichthys violaceus]|uniref:uncharacterized protein n=1 Tax=Cebidichthys violaceus TaxID=271503 RepID=UPI0035CA935B
MYILCVKMIFLMLIFLLEGLWETEAMSVTGELGKEVKIKCSHSNAFGNVKYFCKGACDDKNVLIRSINNKKDSNEKYSITDEGNTFYVTISRLTEDDSGTYKCGIDRIGVDTYNEVVLTVIKGNTQDSENYLSQTSTANKLVYIGAGLGLLVLVLATVLLIFFRHRNRDIHTSSGNNHDTVYATLSRQKQDGHHVATSSSTANKYQETGGRTNSILSSSAVQLHDFRGDPSDDVYSNVSVSSASQIQPDGLLYTTVSFNKHTDGGADAPDAAALTYSAIQHQETDESAVYYNVRTQL